MLSAGPDQEPSSRFDSLLDGENAAESVSPAYSRNDNLPHFSNALEVRLGLEALRYREQLRIQESNLAEMKRRHQRQEEIDEQTRNAHQTYETNCLRLDAMRYGFQYRLDVDDKQGMLDTTTHCNQIEGNHNGVVERQQWSWLQEEGCHHRK